MNTNELIKIIEILSKSNSKSDSNDMQNKLSTFENGSKHIVILQRGNVMMGDFYRYGSDCELRNASVIRRWGTTGGLGEIAKNGPVKSGENAPTVLDDCNGTVYFDYLTVVAAIKCTF